MPCIWTGHDALVLVKEGHWQKIGSHTYTYAIHDIVYDVIDNKKDNIHDIIQLTVYWTDWDPVLDVCRINVDKNRYWNRFRSHTNLGQLKIDRSIGVTAQDAVLIGIIAEFESKVLTPCHAFVRKQLHEHLRHFPLDKRDVLKSISFLPHVDDFDVAILDCLHQALVHIMVDLICIEICIVKDPLYRVFHYS
jgi:hypothetical protein